MSPEQQRSIEGLVAQVNADNVVQAAALIRKHADDIEDALNGASRLRAIEPLGDDPVSHDAVGVFQPKIDEILAAQWAHWAELVAGAKALVSAAQNYGYTENDITAAIERLHSR